MGEGGKVAGKNKSQLLTPMWRDCEIVLNRLFLDIALCQEIVLPVFCCGDIHRHLGQSLKFQDRIMIPVDVRADRP